jgi:hypothetical protein
MSDNQVTWRKSSYTAEQGQCVELASTGDMVRDSKDPEGPVLVFSQKRLAAFIGGLKQLHS